MNSGVGYDRMLLDWLHTYTFPTEASFKDIQVAKEVYPKVVVSVCMPYLFSTLHPAIVTQILWYTTVYSVCACEFTFETA